jgi:hypothetical protein
MPVKRLTAQEAKNLVRLCLEDGVVTWGPHFRKALADETFAIEDVYDVLQHGTIYDAPEPDIRTGEWKYTVEGHIEDGQWVKVVFCFKAEDKTFLITVFTVERRRRPT